MMGLVRFFGFSAAVLLAVSLVRPADASLLTFTDRASWRAAAGGGVGDLTEDFNSVVSDLPYSSLSIRVGFVTLSTSFPFGDDSWRVDAPPDRFPPPPTSVASVITNIDGTTFATILAGTLGFDRFGSIPSSVLDAGQKISAIGFDFGPSDSGGAALGFPEYHGTVIVTTSLGDESSYTNTTTTGGFFGIVYDDGELFDSLSWSVPNGVMRRYSGIDNIEAFTSVDNPDPLPQPATIAVFGLGLLGLGAAARARSV